MNIDINLILPEIFLSLSIMTLLMIGVFKKNSTKFINLIIFRLKSCSKFCSQLFLRERYDYLSNFYNIYGTIKSTFSNF